MLKGVKGYRYRVTVEPMEGPTGERIEQSPIVFEALNHDEILGRVECRRRRGEFDSDTGSLPDGRLKAFLGSRASTQ